MADLQEINLLSKVKQKEKFAFPHAAAVTLPSQHGGKGNTIGLTNTKSDKTKT